MNAHSSGLSGSPYSPIQLAPASSVLNRRMSSRGTWQTIAPKRSGRRLCMLPIKRPPLLPPMMPRCAGDVTFRATRSSAIAMKSS